MCLPTAVQVDLERHEGVREASPDALHLLTALLQHDPARRLSAQQALKHPWICNHVPHMCAAEPVAADHNPSTPALVQPNE